MTGGPTNSFIVGIRSNRNIYKINFWKGKKCYAVEPFINIYVLPGKSLSWGWQYYIGKNSVKSNYMTNL
jgi:hypothetical protein